MVSDPPPDPESAGFPDDPTGEGEVNPREPAERLLRDLRTRRSGLRPREAERRLSLYGPNELTRSGRGRWLAVTVHVLRQHELTPEPIG